MSASAWVSVTVQGSRGVVGFLRLGLTSASAQAGGTREGKGQSVPEGRFLPAARRESRGGRRPFPAAGAATQGLPRGGAKRGCVWHVRGSTDL